MVTNYLTNNRCYTKPVKMVPRKLVLHSLGVAQPSCNGFLTSWNNQASSKCVHAFIEADRIVKTLPWDYKGWHVGTGSKGSWNSCAIGVEICEPKGHTYKGGTMVGYDVTNNAEYFEKVYKNAVWLFSELCEKYELDPLKDIYCHSEVCALGYASNHSDVMQWFPKHGKSMDTFRSDVKARMKA